MRTIFERILDELIAIKKIGIEILEDGRASRKLSTLGDVIYPLAENRSSPSQPVQSSPGATCRLPSQPEE